MLGLTGSLSRIVQMEVRMLSMYKFASSLQDTHLHTSKMTFIG